MVRTLEYCSVNWQVRTCTWFTMVIYGLWSANRQYVVRVRGAASETPVSCLD
jgi:hypothetical protein